MPTQIPSGSAMAVKVKSGGGRRKAKGAGPLRLKYADGGLVGKVTDVMTAAGKAAGTERGKAIAAAEKAVARPKQSEEALATYSRRLDPMKYADKAEGK